MATKRAPQWTGGLPKRYFCGGIEKILSGEKTWEIRGSKTKKRGRIALAEAALVC